MCGRINIHDSERIREFLSDLGLPVYPVFPPRYNITPDAMVPVLHQQTFTEMQWGIRFGRFHHPNTRVATALGKPWLRPLLQHRRCIVPANRFYEWPDPKARPAFAGIKTRFCVHNRDDVLLFGGICRTDEDGVDRFNILTTEPNEAINRFHHRMPLLIDPANIDTWMETTDLEQLQPLLGPSTQDLDIYECDQWVDNGRHDDARCMAPAGSG